MDSKNYSEYTHVFHCAGIANPSSDNIYEVNRDLTYRFASKLKEDGVPQFIFLSSMAVYGLGANAQNTLVDAQTQPVPKDDYGKSKLEAEKELASLADERFHIHIIRAPSIYGRNTENYLNNYRKLAKYHVFLDVFQDLKRSAVYIDNLSELVLCICRGDNSARVNSDLKAAVYYYFPQNKEQFSTAQFVKAVADAEGRSIWMVKPPKWLTKVLAKSKLFGIFAPIAYDIGLSSSFDYDYCVVTTQDSIVLTLKK